MSEESPIKTLSQKRRQLLRQGDGRAQSWRRTGDAGDDNGAGGNAGDRDTPSAGREVSPPAGVEGRQDALIDGRFRLLRRLGSGRLGDVYEARIDAGPESALEQLVALQLFDRRIAADLALIEKLRRGYAALRASPHRNVVRLEELGRDRQTWYLVMERLEGVSLRFVIDDVGAVPPHEAHAIVRAVGDALSYLHAKGMVHGAVAPSSVFVTEDYEVRLLDIVPASPPSGLPTEGGASDSRQAAAPHPVDDVFGLACLTYELMTGRHPYNYSTAAEARRLGLAPRVIDELPAVRWQALARGLAPDPNARPASVAVFLMDLGLSGAERLKEPRPAQQSPQPPPPPRPAPPRAAQPTKTQRARPPRTTEPQRAAQPPQGAQPERTEPAGQHRTESAVEAPLIPDPRDRLSMTPPPRPASGRWLWPAFGAAVVGFLAAVIWVYQIPIRDVVVNQLTSVGIDVISRRNAGSGSTREAGAGDNSARSTGDNAGDAVGNVPAASTDQVARVDLPAEPETAPLLRAGDAGRAESDAGIPQVSAVTEGSASADGALAEEAATVEDEVDSGSADAADARPADRDEGPSPSADRAETTSDERAELARTEAPPVADSRPADAASSSRFFLGGQAIRAEEGGPAAAIPVRREGGLALPATIVWWTTEDTARPGEDYADLGRRTETFGPGVETLTLYVPLVDDGIAESPEGFLVTIGRPDPASGRVEPIATTGVIIQDDDNSPR